jgi:hypothetical protein
MRCLPSLLFSVVILVGGCDEPVRVGIQQARAAGISVTTPSHAIAGPPAGLPVVKVAFGGGRVMIPSLPQPQATGDIVGLKLEREGTGEVRCITFGQVFMPGQLPRGSGLMARIDGHEVPAQLDEKTTNPDGSIRFGIVTINTAAPAAVMLVRGGAATAAPVDLAAMLDKYDLSVELVMHGAKGDVPHTYAAGELLAAALRSGKASYWLRGPLATEARVDVAVESSLHLTFDIRGYADGSTFTDVQANNDIAMQPVGGTLNYDVTINQHGKPIFHKAAIQHYQYETWHYEAWSNGDPKVNVVHDAAAMERAGAVWGYDLSKGIDAKSVADAESAVGKPGYTDILGSASLTKDMGTTGGRSDIGPLPSWDVFWLITQNWQVARFALAQADAAGAIPWHLFDPTTKTYVTLDKWPKLWDDGRAGNGTTAMTQMSGDAAWGVDSAHQPGLSYLAYLATGLRYYLDQLDAQAAWNLVAVWPPMRLDGSGIVTSTRVQLRGAAWSLRELVEAAYINPDDAPLAGYFKRYLAGNIDYLLAQAKSAHQGEAYGWELGDYGYPKVIAPWQDDFLATTVILATAQGVPGAKQFLLWQTNFLANRFLVGDKGFSPFDGVAYNLQLWDKSPDQPYQTWREIAAASQHWSGGGSDYPKGTDAYYRAAVGVLSGISTVTDSAEAKRALAWLLEHPLPASAWEWPQWSIVR